MQEYDLKRGHWKNVDLDGIFTEHFGSFEKTEDDQGTWYVAKGPALKVFKICVQGKTNCLVDIEGDLSAPEEDHVQAVKLKNVVLMEVTGFTAKQRAKRAQEKAKKGN